MKQEKLVVIPTDFSEYGNYALEYAKLFAKKYKLSVHLITVFEKETIFSSASEEKIIEFEEKLSIIAKKWKSEIAITKTAVCIGKIPEEIVAYAEENSADLIIMGSHGSVVHSKFFSSSNAEQVVRFFKGDVLVIKHPLVEQQLKNIVFASNFKPESTQIFPKIHELAEKFDAKIHLLFVNTKDYFKTTKEINERFTHFIETERIDALLGDNYSTSIYCDHSLERGVLNYCLENEIDLICMGTHGKHGFIRLMKDSASQNIVNLSFRPVLTLKI